MKISYIGFKNIMGIKELEFTPGKVTVVEGKNGRGKTSVLRGIQAGIGGGHDATLLTGGQEKGEVVIVFDDGMKLEKKIKRKSSKVSLTDREGKDIPRAASFLREIVDDIAVNPIKILTANAKDRVKLLLDSVPMQTPFDDLDAITGEKLDRTDTRHPMQVIDEKRASAYGERTDNNRYLKEKKTLVSQMREGLPFKADERDFTAEVKELEGKLSLLEKENAIAKDSAADWKTEMIDQLRGEMEFKINEARQVFDRKCALVQKDHDEDIAKVVEKNAPVIAELNTKIGETKALSEEALRVASSIQYIKDGENEIRVLEDESEGLTGVIEALDDLKANMLTRLPVKGLEVKDGEIYLDGVPFDNVNKAKRVQFALSIASLRTAELPIVCVDNLEALDEESFAIFQDLASKTDMQFFVTRVSESPELNIDTGE